MLAVGGTSCISLVSVAAADENSLTPLHRLLPTETASLGFGGNPVGGGDKNSRVIFFTFLCGGYHLPSGCCGCVGTTRRGVYFGRKTAFSEWVLCADERAVHSCTQRFFGVPAWGWYHYPRRALRVLETPDGRLSKRLICRFLRSGGRSSPHDSYFLANTQNFLLAVPVANAFALWYDKFSKLEFVRCLRIWK